MIPIFRRYSPIEVPEPSKPQLDDLPSGKILLRLPRSLHAQLIEQARQDNVSLNQHLVAVLTASTAANYIRTAVAQQMKSFNKTWVRSLVFHHLDVSSTVRLFSTRTETTRSVQDRPQIFAGGGRLIKKITNTAEAAHG